MGDNEQSDDASSGFWHSIQKIAEGGIPQVLLS